MNGDALREIHRLGGLENEIGVAVGQLDQPFQVLDAVEQLGMFPDDIEELGSDRSLIVLDRLGTGVGDDLPAPHTLRLVRRGVTPTPRTVDRPDRLGFVALVDIDAVDLRDLAIALLAEDGDVTSGDAGAPDPAVVVLDVRLVEVLRRQVGRRRLSEVSAGDRPRDAGPIGSLLEELALHAVADPLGAVELRPQRGVRIVPCRMLGEPPGDERHGGNDQRASGPGLPVLDRDLQPVLVVGDVPDVERVQLAGSRAEVPGDCDVRSVAAIVAGVDHGADVVLPPEHVPRVGRRIVAVGVRRGDPFEGVRRALAIGQNPPEDPQGNPVVAVVLLVVVLPVDVRDDDFCSVAVLEGRGEASTVLCEPDEMPEQFFVADVRPLRSLELDLAGELPDGGRVVIVDRTAVQPRTKPLDTGPGVAVGHANGSAPEGSLTQGIGTPGSDPSPGIIPNVPSPKITRRGAYADFRPGELETEVVA